MFTPSPPEQILIVGAGIFGLSTALSLLERPSFSSSHITILDSSPTLPNPSGSSVDSSRIVRADYASKPYAKLALAAQKLWRDQTPFGWGGEGRYHEPGFLLTAETGREWYVDKCLANVSELAKLNMGLREVQVEALNDQDAIKQASGYDHVSGERGYVNWGSGWADAEECVSWAVKILKTEAVERVTVRSGVNVKRLLYASVAKGKSSCVGAELEGGEKITADLTILAAGAWSPTLIDLTGRAVATGQALTYLDISEDEQKMLEGRPTVMNMSRGIFIIPPRKRELKVARHGFGYRHLRRVKIAQPPTNKSNGVVNGNANHAEEDKSNDTAEVEISVPVTGIPVPEEAQDACREALRDFLPEMASRPYSRTRLCWYCDT